jgi:hypothetical protein
MNKFRNLIGCPWPTKTQKPIRNLIGWIKNLIVNVIQLCCFVSTLSGGQTRIGEGYVKFWRKLVQRIGTQSNKIGTHSIFCLQKVPIFLIFYCSRTLFNLLLEKNMIGTKTLFTGYLFFNSCNGWDVSMILLESEIWILYSHSKSWLGEVYFILWWWPKCNLAIAKCVCMM